jgi:hypothetical protein
MVTDLTRFESKYSSCTVRNSENICSSSGGAQEKGKTPETQFTTKIDGFLSFTPPHPLNATVLLCRFLKNLTLCMTKLRVLMLCFSYIRDNSIKIRRLQTKSASFSLYV